MTVGECWSLTAPRTSVHGEEVDENVGGSVSQADAERLRARDAGGDAGGALSGALGSLGAETTRESLGDAARGRADHASTSLAGESSEEARGETRLGRHVAFRAGSWRRGREERGRARRGAKFEDRAHVRRARAPPSWTPSLARDRARALRWRAGKCGGLLSAMSFTATRVREARLFKTLGARKTWVNPGRIT